MVLCLNLKHSLKCENKVKNLHCMYVMSYFFFIKSVSVVATYCSCSHVSVLCEPCS